MRYSHRLKGCCSSGSALDSRPLGQLDPGSWTGTIGPIEGEEAPTLTLSSLFGMSVAAGVTVWALTRFLGGKKP